MTFFPVFGKKIVEIVYLGFLFFSDRRKKTSEGNRMLKIVKNLKIFKKFLNLNDVFSLKLYIWDSPPSVIEGRSLNL